MEQHGKIPNDKFFILGHEEFFSTFGEDSNIFVVFYNDGLTSSCHAFEAPEKPLQFKKTSITRGRSISVKNKEDFCKAAQDYMKINAFEECFPPNYLIQNSDVKVLITHLFSSKSNSKRALVGYNFISHLKIYGYTDKDLESFSSSVDQEHSNVIMFFDNQKNLLVYIRVCGKSPTNGRIKKEMKMCDEFIRALLLIHEKTVTDDNTLSICAFVALPDTSSEDLKNKTFINSHHLGFLLLKEDFNDCEKFNAKIDNSYQLAKNLQKDSGKTARKHAAINNILAESMVSMVCTNAFLPRLSRNEHDQVLSLLLNAEQYEAINYPIKKRIIRGPFGSGKSLILEKIVEKLIAAIKTQGVTGTIYYIMFESYSLLEARMDEVFDELNIDKNHSIKLRSSNLQKLSEEANHLSDDNKIEAVMNYCLKKSKADGVVHFLFDEVDGSYFTEKNSIGLKNYIKTSSSDDATLILALQCTQKNQRVHKKEKEYKMKSFCKDDNNNKTGMKLLEPLTKSMRMVSKIYNLKKIAEDIIQPHSTKLALKNDIETKSESSENTEKLKELTKTPTAPIGQRNPPTSRQIQSNDFRESSRRDMLSATREFFAKDSAVKNADSSKFQEKTDAKDVNAVDKIDVAKPKTQNTEKADGNYPHQKKSSDNQIPSTSLMSQSPQNATPQKKIVEKVPSSPNQMPTDQLPIHYPGAFTENVDHSSQVFETKYDFHQSENGVFVEGSKKPSIIYLDNDLDIYSSKAASILATVFETEIFIDKSKKTTIICNNWEQSLLTLFSLELSSLTDKEYCEYIPVWLENGIPSKDEKQKIWKRCNSDSHLVLVTDFQGFRGCETEVCVTFVHPEDLYLRHIMVEVLARAVTNLVIIVLPSKDSKDQLPSKGNFQQVLGAWVNKEAVDVYKIFMSGKKFSLKKANVIEGEGEFKRENDKKFESFKSKWTKKKGTSHPEPRR